VVEEFRNRITGLETELATKESELLQERQVKEDLMNQAFAVAQSQDSEQKVKDEKFNRLKDVYVKLRNDHIQKLREKAEVDKKLAQTMKRLEDLEQSKADLDSTIVQLRGQVSKVEERFQKSSCEQNDELEALKRDKELFNMETEILKKSINDVCKERDDMVRELKGVQKQNEELRAKLEDLLGTMMHQQEEAEMARKNFDNEFNSMVAHCLESSEKILRNALDEVDNPALTALSCSPDYLRGLTKGCLMSLEYENNLVKCNDSYVVVTANEMTHRIAVFVLLGTATGNKSPDINFGERMADECKLLGEIILKILRCFKDRQDTSALQGQAVAKLEEVAALADNINVSLMGVNAGNLVDMLEDELAQMDKAIEEAANRIQDMLTKSRKADSGIKLEVNSKLLDSCTNLMEAIRILVKKARLLQAEIVAQGKGTASAKEFYKRNHQWTDGFISAAKAVAAAAKFLLTAADKVVSSNGKLEHMVVAAQEIAASTAQLVVASRVKADRNSNNLQQLTQASKGVTVATGTVVATVKDCSQLIDENEELDTTNLTLHQAKTLEMESQVRVLELEKELEQERNRLMALRKHHYKLEDENEA
jgi:huntingtin interacting protein 1